MPLCFLQPPEKEPCQTSQTSLDEDQSADTPSPTTPSPVPLPRRLARPGMPAEEHQASVPVPLPRFAVSHKDPEEVGRRLADEVLESEKAESEASTKTSSSDSGIEDGKITPTMEEEKVLSKICFISRSLFKHFKMKFVLITTVNSPGGFRDTREWTVTPIWDDYRKTWHYDQPAHTKGPYIWGRDDWHQRLTHSKLESQHDSWVHSHPILCCFPGTTVSRYPERHNKQRNGRSSVDKKERGAGLAASQRKESQSELINGQHGIRQHVD